MLETSIDSCLLRPWRATDRSALVLNANNHRVWRNLTHQFPYPYIEEDADSWLQFAAKPGRNVLYAIEFQGCAVGGIGAIAGVGIAERTASVGYWLGEPYWRKGLATAAATAFTAHLVGRGCFSRLEAQVFEWNPASMRVLEKAGFTREARLRKSVSKDGALIDSVLYAYIIAG